MAEPQMNEGPGNVSVGSGEMVGWLDGRADGVPPTDDDDLTEANDHCGATGREDCGGGGRGNGNDSHAWQSSWWHEGFQVALSCLERVFRACPHPHVLKSSRRLTIVVYLLPPSVSRIARCLAAVPLVPRPRPLSVVWLAPSSAFSETTHPRSSKEASERASERASSRPRRIARARFHSPHSLFQRTRYSLLLPARSTALSKPASPFQTSELGSVVRSVAVAKTKEPRPRRNVSGQDLLMYT